MSIELAMAAGTVRIPVIMSGNQFHKNQLLRILPPENARFIITIISAKLY